MLRVTTAREAYARAAIVTYGEIMRREEVLDF